MKLTSALLQILVAAPEKGVKLSFSELSLSASACMFVQSCTLKKTLT
jgi:hypothetical protein